MDISRPGARSQLAEHWDVMQILSVVSADLNGLSRFLGIGTGASPEPETHGSPSGFPHSTERREMIDLNTATAEELDTVAALRGHGFEIVRYREERGRFTSLRQLDEVPGLSGKTGGVERDVDVGKT
ncbi:helix-hairpin-helix domain-containing protein [Methylobacterium sp. E-025]|uniref:ComEA family DNA-binding protein n=1 Tax=Methylobacterium sp. E-025 TaxID=2836561 RepID=UPI001FBAE672|nr:helix-hairpin-helix domain-containing protein [Methylobacterium sp. E-025]MCJ2113526.1 helix-hairpin-helix domain-containing protein [Methylobacterium sp. E-025]